MKEIKEYLKKSKNKKTITYEELLNIFKEIDYNQLCNKIYSLVNDGFLKGKKKPGFNGRNPILYKEYWIIEVADLYIEEIEEIKNLNSSLNIDYYLKKPKEYIKNRKFIQQLNNYIIFHGDKLKENMSINERSFDIWGDEKLLRKSSTETILKNLMPRVDALNVYSTPEPFFYYINDNSINSILIVENKDTWFTLRKLLKENKTKILGEYIGLLIYGEGKKIESSYEFLKEEDVFKPFSNSTISYWGDIDFEGIDIVYRLNKKLTVKLFSVAYKKMIYLAQIEKLNEMKEAQKKCDFLSEFMINFTENEKKKLINIFEEKKYIPQEIINYQEMRKDNEF